MQCTSAPASFCDKHNDSLSLSVPIKVIKRSRQPCRMLVRTVQVPDSTGQLFFFSFRAHVLFDFIFCFTTGCRRHRYVQYRHKCSCYTGDLGADLKRGARLARARGNIRRPTISIFLLLLFVTLPDIYFPLGADQRTHQHLTSPSIFFSK